MRRLALLSLFLVSLAACGQAGPTRTPSIPPVPAPADGWESLGGVGTSGPGFTGLTAEVAGRPLAIAAVCAGTESLVVAYGAEGAPSGAGRAAVVFPCSTTTDATMRYELPPGIEAGTLEVDGAVIEGYGAVAGTAFSFTLEQAAP